MIYEFEGFELDAGLCELRKDGEVRHIEPQVFDVLLHLVRNADRLVTKDELLDEVWGHRFVTPAAVSARIKSARRALEDDGRTQRFIRTIRGRGFRFVVPVREQPDHPVLPAASLLPPSPAGNLALVPRRDEIDRLRGLLSTSLDGKRQVVLIAGEPGIGKTTLLDSFMAGLGGLEVRVGRGRSLEQRGAGEPYLSVLEALGRLARGPGGAEVVSVLAHHAPGWLAEMPGLAGPEELERLRRSPFAPTTRERMLREMVETVEALSAGAPVLLVLEDLHWADRSTLDLLLWLGLRAEPARFMLVGTYRSGPLEVDLRSVLSKLRIEGRLEEIELGPWGAAEVDAYLAARFGVGSLPQELGILVLERTGGNPLFVRSLVDQWVEEGDLVREGEAWRLATRPVELATHLPVSLREAIEQQVARLDPETREVLEAASVAGTEFLATVVATAVGGHEEEVEDRCARLALSGNLVVAGDPVELPDGTITAGFAFAHDLYREAIYRRIPPARRVRMHALAGGRLEEAWGGEAIHHGAQLALHFLHGRDEERAVQYLTVAGRQSLQRSAHREAVEHLETALSILQRCPRIDGALERELAIQQMLGPARLEVGGWGDPGAERAYVRARELAEQLEDAARAGQAMYGLAYVHEVRGEYPRAQELVSERLRLCTQWPDDQAFLEAHDLLSCSLLHQGRFREALDNAEAALQVLPERGAGADTTSFGHHPAVSSRYWAGIARWFIGDPDGGLALVREARALAAELGHLPSLAFAEARLARIHHLRGEVDDCAAHARAALELSEERGFPYQRSLAATFLGWATARGGDPEVGAERIRQELELQKETGAVMDRPYELSLLAEALLVGDRDADALDVLDAAIAEAAATGDSFFWSAELHRLRGVSLEALGRMAEAEEAFREALGVATDQGAPPLARRTREHLERLRATR